MKNKFFVFMTPILVIINIKTEIGVLMSMKNQAQNIQFVPPTPKEQEEFLYRCDKLYWYMLQNHILFSQNQK